MAEQNFSTKKDRRGRLPFEEIEHTADNALKVFGSDLAELLFNAARGMNSLMAAEHESTMRPEEKLVELEAVDAESLLVEWLSELAYWAETESLLFDEFDLHRISSTRIQATLRGKRVDRLEKHIKAVTYHNLEIVQTAEGLTATIVFDV